MVASLVALPRVALPNTSKVPDTSRPPLISTFPLAELIIRSPVEVSIVLAVVCAILTLPNSTEPPLNVPDTVKLPPTNTLFAIPTPPEITKSPVVVDVDCVPCVRLIVLENDVIASNLTS